MEKRYRRDDVVRTPKPLFRTRARNQEAAAVRSTLATLRAVFGTEVLPYYDQFPENTLHKVCCALVAVVVLLGLRVLLVLAVVGAGIRFQVDTLRPLNAAFSALFAEGDEAPDGPAAASQVLNGLNLGLVVVGLLLVLVDVALGVVCLLRHVYLVSVFLATSLLFNFVFTWTIFAAGLSPYHSPWIASALIGGTAAKDFALHPTGQTFHILQSELGCCGFRQGPADWHNPVPFRWDEPGAMEMRSFPLLPLWMEACPTDVVCASPKSCCVTIDSKRVDNASVCNLATMPRNRFDRLIQHDPEHLWEDIEVAHPKRIITKGCVSALTGRIDAWARINLFIGVVLVPLWFFAVGIVSLSLSEIDGIGSVDPKTQRVDASTVKDVMPFGYLLDNFCCCGGGEKWPVMDDNSEREAIREDRKALVQIEEGKGNFDPARTSLHLFLPDFRDAVPEKAVIVDGAKAGQPKPKP